MLGNECMMPFHRRLLIIILWERRRQSGSDEINAVGSDGFGVLGLDVLEVLVRQFEPGSEFGFFEGGEGCGWCSRRSYGFCIRCCRTMCYWQYSK